VNEPSAASVSASIWACGAGTGSPAQRFNKVDDGTPSLPANGSQRSIEQRSPFIGDTRFRPRTVDVCSSAFAGQHTAKQCSQKINVKLSWVQWDPRCSKHAAGVRKVPWNGKRVL
jgi:hypothetical protein